MVLHTLPKINPEHGDGDGEDRGYWSADVLLTPAIADRYLKLGEYPLQRPLSDAHVIELVEEMENGTFQCGTDIDIAEVGKRFYLINGQHTCAAIVASGIPQWVCEKRYICADLMAVGRIYARIDIQKTRTPYVRLRALGVPDSLGINQQETQGIVAGLKLVLAGFRQPPGANVKTKNLDRAIFKSADVWAEAVESYRTEITQYIKAIDRANTRLLRRKFLRGGACAMGFVTLRHQPERAWDFWSNAAADDRLPAKHPAHQLTAWLQANSPGSGSRAVGQAKAVAACWNAYFDGREMTFVRPICMSQVGVTIKGTPFKARDKQ